MGAMSPRGDRERPRRRSRRVAGTWRPGHPGSRASDRRSPERRSRLPAPKATPRWPGQAAGPHPGSFASRLLPSRNRHGLRKDHFDFLIGVGDLARGADVYFFDHRAAAASLQILEEQDDVRMRGIEETGQYLPLSPAFVRLALAFGEIGEGHAAARGGFLDEGLKGPLGRDGRGSRAEGPGMFRDELDGLP